MTSAVNVPSTKTSPAIRRAAKHSSAHTAQRLSRSRACRCAGRDDGQPCATRRTAKAIGRSDQGTAGRSQDQPVVGSRSAFRCSIRAENRTPNAARSGPNRPEWCWRCAPSRDGRARPRRGAGARDGEIGAARCRARRENGTVRPTSAALPRAPDYPVLHRFRPGFRRPRKEAGGGRRDHGVQRIGKGPALERGPPRSPAP